MTETRNNVPHAVTWFEIPTRDFARAVAFYERVLGVSLPRDNMDGEDYAVFPHDPARGAGGCLVDAPRLQPGPDGVNLFLYVPGGLEAPLSRVEAAGGRILAPRRKLNDEIGYVAAIRDTEGNRVGLHCFHG